MTTSMTEYGIGKAKRGKGPKTRAKARALQARRAALEGTRTGRSSPKPVEAVDGSRRYVR